LTTSQSGSNGKRFDRGVVATAPVVRATGSTADLYPRLVAMQRTMQATAFAMLSVKANTLINPGTLTVVVESSFSDGSPAPAFISDFRHKLLAHLKALPHPLVFTAAGAFDLKSDPSRIRQSGNPHVTAIAFPVQLGAMGNGYTVFFGPRVELDPDILIDLHRKSFVVMREALKLDFNSMVALESLNDREIECLQLVGNGMKSEAIGEQLHLSVHTVNAYLGSATTKLDAVNRIQAIAKAIRLGLIG